MVDTPNARWAPSRRALLRGGLATALSLGGLAAVGACAPPKGAVGEPAPKEPRPSYYPGDYDAIVEASKKETELTVYSNMDSYNWQPILAGFQEHYPWIEKVTTTNLGSSEVFQRYYAESSRSSARASLLVSGAPQNWTQLSEEGGLSDYQSPELEHLPDFAQPRPNVYTFSSDVIVMAYNKLLVKAGERPDTLTGIADLAEREPRRFKHKVTTYTTDASFGRSIHLAYFRAQQKKRPDDPWNLYDRLLPFTRAEESSGPMLDKIASGEYLMGYFMSSTIVFPNQTQFDKVVRWSYIKDASPLFLRGMGVPKNAPQPNAGKLLLDYILSHEGQVNVGRGGFTPYREDVTSAESPVTYRGIREEVGAENVVLIDYDLGTKEQQEAFGKKWVSKLG